IRLRLRLRLRVSSVWPGVRTCLTSGPRRGTQFHGPGRVQSLGRIVFLSKTDMFDFLFGDSSEDLGGDRIALLDRFMEAFDGLAPPLLGASHIERKFLCGLAGNQRVPQLVRHATSSYVEAKFLHPLEKPSEMTVLG